MPNQKPAQLRYAAFVRAFVSNGHNGRQAAIAAGYAAKTAHVTASKLLTIANIQDQIAELTEKTAAAAEITITETLREAKAILQSDVRAYYDDKGRLKPVHEWTPSMAAAVSSVEVDNQYSGTGKKRRLVSSTTKLRFWDKNSAIANVMRHLGMFDKDNQRKMPNLNVQLLFVGPPE